MGVERNAREDVGGRICNFQRAIGTVGRVPVVLSRSGRFDSYMACISGGPRLLVVKEYRRNN